MARRLGGHECPARRHLETDRERQLTGHAPPAPRESGCCSDYFAAVLPAGRGIRQTKTMVK